jgi:glucose-6-phosphate dehydrogenase assembly protein OpcA
MELDPTKPISTEAILKKLDDLWVNMGNKEAESSDGVLRACSLTLVVCTDGASEVGETLAKLMRDHPARLIVLRLLEAVADEKKLSADVVAQCWMPFGTKQQICCEQIEIAMTPNTLGGLAPLVRGLVAPDLPVVVWCRGRALVSHPDFQPVLALANKLIVDSSGGRDLADRLALIRAARDRDTRVADLAWTRITRWRESVASIFDSPAYFERLSSFDHAAIDYQGPHKPMAACYLSAWLQHCVGGGLRFDYHNSGPAPRARLHRLTLSGGEMCVSLTVGLDQSVEMQSVRSAHTQFQPLSEYELMREELKILGEDPVYEAVLHLAPEFV